MPNVGAVKSTNAAGLPAGGAANQLLAKVADTDYQTGWANVGGGSALVSNTWYDNRITAGDAAYDLGIPAASAYFFPVYIPSSVQISSLGIFISQAGSAVACNFGWYNTASSGLPGNLISSGSFTTNTAVGAQVIAATPFTAVAGFNWIYINSPNTWYAAAAWSGCFWSVGINSPQQVSNHPTAYVVTGAPPAATSSLLGVSYAYSWGTTAPVIWFKTA